MICVCGIGYVGLVTALCLSNGGYKIICLDTDKQKIELLKAGNPIIYESGIKDLLRKALDTSSIVFTNDKKAALTDANIIFVCVGTPTVDGNTDLSNINNLLEDIYAYSDSDKTIIIKSTVPVGTCDQLQSKLQSMGEKKFNFTVVSNPEFLREGSAVKDFLYPERIIIGSSNLLINKTLEGIYKKILPKKVPIILTDARTSEMIKYASNTFLCVKISFINEIAKLATKTGANIADIEFAVGLDKRIGHAHLQSGPGFGGSCLPKDLDAFINFGVRHGVEMSLCKAAKQINKDQINILIDLLKEEVLCIKGKKVALWGVTFKKDTNDVRYSPAVSFVEQLYKLGAKFSIYDSVGIPNFKIQCSAKENIQYVADKYYALENADFLVIMTDWDEFNDVNFSRIKNAMNTPILIDCRKMYWEKRDYIESIGIQYKYIGLKSIEEGQ